MCRIEFFTLFHFKFLVKLLRIYNQFILKFQALQQSLDLVLENANKPNGIKIPEYDIFSIYLSSKDYSERSYNYIKNGEIDFVHIKE